MTVQTELNSHLLEWDNIISSYRAAVHRQAQSEADYKHQRAKFITRARAEQPGLSQAAADSLADADDTLHALRVGRLGSDAEVEAYKAKLAWCRAQADSLRSQKVDERESNRLYADHPAGA